MQTLKHHGLHVTISLHFILSQGVTIVTFQMHARHVCHWYHYILKHSMCDVNLEQVVNVTGIRHLGAINITPYIGCV